MLKNGQPAPARIFGYVAALSLFWAVTFAYMPAQTTGVVPRPELFVQAGAVSGQTIGASAFSPDGAWYVTGNGTEWQLWSTRLGELRRWQPVPATIVSTLAIAADAKTILSLGTTVLTRPQVHDGTVAPSDLTTKLYLVDAVSGHLIRNIELEGATVSLAAHPTQMVAATLDADFNTVRIISITDGSVLFEDRMTNADNIRSSISDRVFFSPDGSILAAYNGDSLVLWRWQMKNRIFTFDASTRHAPNLDREVPVNYRGKSVSTAGAEKYDQLGRARFDSEGRQLILCSKDELTVLDVAGGGAVRPHSVTNSPARQLFSDCGFFPEDRIYASTYDVTDLGTNTLLIDRKTGSTRTLDGTLETVLTVPHRDQVLIGAANSIALYPQSSDTAQPSPYPAIQSVHASFTGAGDRLLWRTTERGLLAWDLESGEASTLPAIQSSGYALAPSGDGKRVAFYENSKKGFDQQVIVLDAPKGLDQGKVIAHLQTSLPATMVEPALNGDGSIAAVLTSNTAVDVYGIQAAKSDSDNPATHIATIHLPEGPTTLLQLALNPSGSALAISSGSALHVYEIPSSKELLHLDSAAPFSNSTVSFSPDGKHLAFAASLQPLAIIDTATWKVERQLQPCDLMPVAFSPDSNILVYAEAARLGSDDKVITFASTGGGVVARNVKTGDLVFRIPSALVGNNSWPAFSPDGKLLVVPTSLGTQILDAHSGVHLGDLWVFGGDSYYDWLVSTPDGRFDATRGGWARASWRFDGNSFATEPVEVFFKQFYRPGLLSKLISGSLPLEKIDISSIDRRQPVVTISTSPGPSPDRIHVTLDVSAPSNAGARDLRLFRNGILAKAWRTELTPTGSGKPARREADIPIAAGDNTLTAWAFNASGVKSEDSSASVTGPDSIQRKGTAYVLAIGVNQYAVQRLSLRYSVSDARSFLQNFAESAKNVDSFGNVVTLALLDQDATADNIRAALAVLGGASPETLTPVQQALFKGLTAVRPEDGVFVYFAGHGVSHDDHFYLIPTDYTPAARAEDTHALVDDDLARAFENISPAYSFLIIDACASGQALAGEDHVGPLDTNGLAQLAFDKGLDILAAAQGNEFAYENATLGDGHGYLTYALVEEGLRRGAAAVDGAVRVVPWFQYAKWRVPELELASQKLSQTDAETPGNVPQHPRVFYRREPTLNQLTIPIPRVP